MIDLLGHLKAPEMFETSLKFQDFLTDFNYLKGALRDGMRFGKNRICVRSDSSRIVERLNREIDEHFQFGESNHYGRYSNSYYRKYDSNHWNEIHKLVNQLMCINIQMVEKTDKNYHRARKLAHEGILT